MNTNDMIDKHYGFGGIMKKIEAALDLAGKDVGSLKVDDLAPVDEFHTRGRESTLEVAEMANVQATDQVIDVGCGLGGTARHLAEIYHCHVTGIDLTDEYISVGEKLTDLVGLGEQVELHQGSALELPFYDDSFDIAWTEHVQMNIEDKQQFYSEIARVLKPGGRFVFHDVFRSSGDSPIYPLPWAEQESFSFLATEEEARAAIEQAGLVIDQWNVKIQESLAFFKMVIAKIEADGPPPLGIHLLMGDNARDKLQNYIRNLSENRTSIAMGLAHKT